MTFYTKQSLWLQFFLILVSCSKRVREKSVSLKNLKEVTLDSTSWTNLCVIKTYPAKKTCYLNKDYSNLYICRQSIADIVYIFEECGSGVSDMAFDTTCRYPIIIQKEFVRQRKDSALIFVPAGFEVNKNAKVLFAKVGFIVES